MKRAKSLADVIFLFLEESFCRKKANVSKRKKDFLLYQTKMVPYYDLDAQWGIADFVLPSKVSSTAQYQKFYGVLSWFI